MELKEKYNNKVRDKLVKYMREMNDSEEGLKIDLAMAAYHKWQVCYDQELKPEEEQITLEQQQMLFEICGCIAQQRDEISDYINEILIAKKEGKYPDFYCNLVYLIISMFDVNQKPEDADEEDTLWIDVSNRNIHNYLVAFIGFCVRCIYEEINKTSEIIDIIAEDDVTDPWHDCINAQFTYDFVRKVYNLSSSDYTQLEENMDNIANSPDYNKEKAKEMEKDLASLMPIVLPVFCGTTLSGCETKEDQAIFRKHLREMIGDVKHKENMETFFVVGMTFICMCPEGTDMFSQLQTHEECIKLFNVWYDCFAGPAMKDYFEPLPEEDKRVVRVAFLGGLLCSLTKNKLSNFDFIQQGCMYKPIK